MFIIKEQSMNKRELWLICSLNARFARSEQGGVDQFVGLNLITGPAMLNANYTGLNRLPALYV